VSSCVVPSCVACVVFVVVVVELCAFLCCLRLCMSCLPVQSTPVLSCPVLSCPVLSCLVLVLSLSLVLFCCPVLWMEHQPNKVCCPPCDRASMRAEKVYPRGPRHARGAGERSVRTAFGTATVTACCSGTPRCTGDHAASLKTDSCANIGCFLALFLFVRRVRAVLPAAPAWLSLACMCVLARAPITAAV